MLAPSPHGPCDRKADFNSYRDVALLRIRTCHGPTRANATRLILLAFLWTVGGCSPDEVYFGTAVNLEQELADQRRQARAERVHLNREQSCEDCLAREGPADFLVVGAA